MEQEHPQNALQLNIQLQLLVQKLLLVLKLHMLLIIRQSEHLHYVTIPGLKQKLFQKPLKSPAL